MQLEIEAPLLTLQPGQVVALQDAAGTRIVAQRGTVWVTEEGDFSDHIVGPGESLVLRRGGRALVQAMRCARIQLH